MDTIQITLAIAAATFAVAVTFAKSSSETMTGYPAGPVLVAGASAPHGHDLLDDRKINGDQGILLNMRD